MPADIETGLLADDAVAEPLADDAVAGRRRAPQRMPRLKELVKKPGLPLFSLLILSQVVGPAVHFSIIDSLWLDFCVFVCYLTLFFGIPLFAFKVMPDIAERCNLDRKSVGSTSYVLSVWLFCNKLAPEHLSIFWNARGLWFFAPNYAYSDYYANDTAYVCPAVNNTFGHFVVNETAPRYDDGFLCGELMNPFFQHWRPVVFGLISWQMVVFVGYFWPVIIRASMPPQFQESQDPRLGCFLRVGFVPMIPFFLVAGLPKGAIWTNALFRVMYIYLFEVFSRAYRVYQGTPATDAHSQPEAVSGTDVLAMLLIAWWLACPWEKPGIHHFVPMSTSEHVEEAFKSQNFHAKLEKSGTFNMMRRISTNFAVVADVDSKSLKQKRKDLVEDAKIAAAEKLDSKDQGKTMPPVFVLSGIRREHILEDSLLKLKDANTFQLLANKFSVSFKDEQGIDAGGVTRDWFDSFANALASGADEEKGNSLFSLATDTTLMPRNTGIDDDAKAIPADIKPKMDNLYTAGRFLALAVLRENPLPLAFGSVLLKAICDETINYRDVQRLDPDFYRIRVEMIMKKGGVAEMNEALGDNLMFVSAAEETVEPKPLKEGGASINVTEENKKEYVLLLCEAHLCNGIRKELGVFLAGFHEVLEVENLRGNAVTHRDLSLLISGVPTLDIDDWKTHCVEHGAQDPQISNWFWEVVGELDDEQKARLLQFTTGSSRLPPGGFKDLKPPFKITMTMEDGEHLPHSHTCFNQLMLARYTSREQLKQKVGAAIDVGDIAGFGFA